MRYFKWKWDETRGDEYDEWGTSIWYIEFGTDLFPSRQMTVYRNGTVLKYDKTQWEDQFGFLADQSLEWHDLGESEEISSSEFEETWSSNAAFNQRKD